VREASKDVEDYYKVRNEKMAIYGEKVMETVVAEDGTETKKETYKYYFTKENGEKFIADLKELEESELTIAIPEIKLDDLASVEIESKYLSVLDWLIKE
jgi:copper oxidase (laccase) domain-containing protein